MRFDDIAAEEGGIFVLDALKAFFLIFLIFLDFFRTFHFLALSTIIVGKKRLIKYFVC